MMRIKILLAIGLIAAAKCSISQDTTGGTRPSFIIPLHTKAQKDKTANSGKPVYTIDSSANKTTMPGNKLSRKKRKYPTAHP